MQQIPDSRTPAPRGSSRSELLILSGLSFVVFLYFMLTAVYSGYGYFIDELYYIACSKRLALGYVDQPPLSVALLALSRWVFGDSLPAVRILPSLAIAGSVFLTGAMALRLGGNRQALIIAALGTIAVPIYLVMGSFYSMNVFEILVWTAILYFLIRLVQTGEPKYWLAIGVLIGLGLELKHTSALYAFAIIVGRIIHVSLYPAFAVILVADREEVQAGRIEGDSGIDAGHDHF